MGRVWGLGRRRGCPGHMPYRSAKRMLLARQMITKHWPQDLQKKIRQQLEQINRFGAVKVKYLKGSPITLL